MRACMGRLSSAFHLQPQPRQRRLQVMRHGGQHARAAVQVAAQAILHGVERARRVAQFARAALLQLRRMHVPADAVGGVRQLRQRPGNVARRHVQHDHQDQHQQRQVDEQIARQRRSPRHAASP